ncbi:hypothetical protein RJ640_026362 [Escallonia rubra]|uniref:CCHC-type domain-containing protein n=1 Tax=Escallonia rubra TaxID=112253 RepID=A0AA88R743_9ASTE|nr:hypothetical protein RJ640_026362 [Escallonia rubra]
MSTYCIFKSNVVISRLLPVSFKYVNSQVNKWDVDGRRFVIMKPSLWSYNEEGGFTNMAYGSLMLYVIRDNEAFLTLVSCWRSECHTFVTAFGEVIVTMEDMCELFRLELERGLLKPLLGNKPESMDLDDWEELQAKVVFMILLNLAPKIKYQTLKTTLLIGKKTLLVDDVISALMDTSRVNGTSSSSQGEGLVVRLENKNGQGRGRCRSRNMYSGHGKDMSKSRGTHNKFSIEYWYCKEIGHIARECPERKDKKNGKKHVNNANVAKKMTKAAMVILLGVIG